MMPSGKLVIVMARDDKRLENVTVEYGDEVVFRELVLNKIAVAIARQMVEDGVQPEEESK